MNGTESIPLAFMQRNSDPRWLETAPGEIKNHTTLMDSSTDNSVSFDIRIDDFLCSDEGTYKCEVFTLLKTLMSTTELHAAGTLYCHLTEKRYLGVWVPLLFFAIFLERKTASLTACVLP